MSAEVHEPADASGAVIGCGPCGLPFGPTASQAEGDHLAAVHNGLHHGGRAEAVLGAAPDVHDTRGLAAAGTELVTVAGQLGWVLDPGVLDDARSQAVPFTGDETASDRAWAARVETAVQGMDVLDSAGFDVWADAHAAAAQPHLAEAVLVSAWETWVRTEYGTTTGADVGASVEPAAEASAEAGWDDAEWAL